MTLEQLAQRIDRLIVIIHRSHSRKAALFCRVEWERPTADAFWGVIRQSYAEIAALHPDRTDFMFCKFWILLDVILSGQPNNVRDFVLGHNDKVFTDRFGQPEIIAFVMPKLRALLD